MFGSHSCSKSGWIHCQFCSRRKFSFLFYEEAVRIWSLCEFSWSFGLQSWCTGSILFKEANFSPHQWRQLLELALVLFLLIIWISDCLCLAHIAEIRMILLSVLFQDGSLSSYFWGSCSNLELMRILLIIWIAVWQYIIKEYSTRKRSTFYHWD